MGVSASSVETFGPPAGRRSPPEFLARVPSASISITHQSHSSAHLPGSNRSLCRGFLRGSVPAIEQPYSFRRRHRTPADTRHGQTSVVQCLSPMPPGFSCPRAKEHEWISPPESIKAAIVPDTEAPPKPGAPVSPPSNSAGGETAPRRVRRDGFPSATVDVRWPVRGLGMSVAGTAPGFNPPHQSLCIRHLHPMPLSMNRCSSGAPQRAKQGSASRGPGLPDPLSRYGERPPSLSPRRPGG